MWKTLYITHAFLLICLLASQVYGAEESENGPGYETVYRTISDGQYVRGHSEVSIQNRRGREISLSRVKNILIDISSVDQNKRGIEKSACATVLVEGRFVGLMKCASGYNSSISIRIPKRLRSGYGVVSLHGHYEVDRIEAEVFRKGQGRNQRVAVNKIITALGQGRARKVTLNSMARLSHGRSGYFSVKVKALSQSQVKICSERELKCGFRRSGILLRRGQVKILRATSMRDVLAVKGQVRVVEIATE